MKKTMTQKRVEWIKENLEAINAIAEPSCPDNCRSACGNGATCAVQSGGGWGYWVRAIHDASLKANPKNYWSGSAPTPSTSIRRGLANFIDQNAPTEIR